MAVQGRFFSLGMLFSQATVFRTFFPVFRLFGRGCPLPQRLFCKPGRHIRLLNHRFHLQVALPGGYYRHSSYPVDVKRVQTPAQPPAFCAGNRIPSHCHYRVCRAGTWQLYLSKRGYDPMRIRLVRRIRLFYDAFQRYLQDKRPEGSLCLPEFASTVFVLAVALLSFSPLHLYGISLGRVLAILAILVFAQCMGITGGGISGTICGMVFTLSGGTDVPASLAYSFAGLAAGLFSSFGKLGCAAAFVITNAVAILCTEGGSPVITGLYEVMIGSVCFMLLPSAFFQKAADYLRPAACRRHLTGRRRGADAPLRGNAAGLCRQSASAGYRFGK